MTEKLYYDDPYKKEFTADIKKHIEKEDGYHLVLNRTMFYPEGGGQPADHGFIGRSVVNYVYEDDGDIYHVVDQLSDKKEDLSCKIDWERRFDLMQQHTGQHLLSAVLKRDSGAGTVGFHLANDYVSIDIDRELAEEELIMVEKRVNEMIYEKRDIITEYPKPAELEKMELRKEPVVEDNIRIVRIEGIDISPCGGTHLDNTGELGLINILDFENYKGGLRIYFLSGKRALTDYKFKNKLVKDARDQLSVPNEEIIGEIGRLKGNLDDKDSLIKELKDELLDYRVEELINRAEKKEGNRIIEKIYEDKSFDEVRYTALKLTETDSNIVIFGQKDSNTARLLVARSENIAKLNAGEIIQEALPLIDGNGGGNKLLAQGGGSGIDNLEKAVEKAYKKIIDKF